MQLKARGRESSLKESRCPPKTPDPLVAIAEDLAVLHFGGGKLTVEAISGSEASNRLLIGGPFTLQGNQVVRSGVVIGVRTSNGEGLNNLEITFNANASTAIVQQLLRSLHFRTVGVASTLQRRLAFTLEDGQGRMSNTPVKTVNVE